MPQLSIPHYSRWTSTCLLTVSASLVSSTCLLVSLLRLPLGQGSHSRGIMVRQLSHLAVADMLDSILALPYEACKFCLVWFGLELPGTGTMCILSYWHNVGFTVSLLLELHIALTTVCAIFGYSLAVNALSRSVTLMWPVGLALGCVFPVVCNGYWDPNPAVQRCKTDTNLGYDIRAWTVLVALIGCILAYVAGMCRISICRGCREVS